MKIIQVSDTHLGRMTDFVFNTNTAAALQKILPQLKKDALDAEAIFLTGDLSQDESIDSYQLLLDFLKPIHKPFYWIPGNHDNISTMRTVLSQASNFFRTNRLSTSNWDFIFLNTMQTDSDTGFLTTSELTLLSQELAKADGKNIVLVMHHHPMKINTPFIDHTVLSNSQTLFDLIEPYPVRLIMCAHAHNEYSIKQNNIRIEIGPATCFQLKKGSTVLSVEWRAGYKIYYFSEDNIDTQTRWVGLG